MIDNRKQDQYFYQILIFTGQRSNAGTNSKVQHFLNIDDPHETLSLSLCLFV